MLALKLLLVPAFLVLISLAGRRWGPSIAGWLAGLPVVAGPILFLLAVEQGQAFAAAAALSSLGAVFATVSYCVVYAHAAQRLTWPKALLAAWITWFTAAWLVSLVPASLPLSALFSLVVLLVGARLFPKVEVKAAKAGPQRFNRAELGLRMLAGAALTVGVTLLADRMGARWSGLLSLFPVLGTVLAVFSHRAQGAAFTAILLRSMVMGLYAFYAFGLVLTVMLRHTSVPLAFVTAIAATLAAQMATRWFLFAPGRGGGK